MPDRPQQLYRELREKKWLGPYRRTEGHPTGHANPHFTKQLAADVD